MTAEGALLWQASAERREGSETARFLRWLADRGQVFDGYEDLWRWSVSDKAAFWGALWEFFGVIHEGRLEQVVTDTPMPRTRWFTGLTERRLWLHEGRQFQLAGSAHPGDRVNTMIIGQVTKAWIARRGICGSACSPK